MLASRPKIGPQRREKAQTVAKDSAMPALHVHSGTERLIENIRPEFNRIRFEVGEWKSKQLEFPGILVRMEYMCEAA